MWLRDFRGEFSYAEVRRCTAKDALFVAASVGFSLLLRRVDLARLLGDLLVR